MARGVSTINTWWKYWKMHSVVALPPKPQTCILRTEELGSEDEARIGKFSQSILGSQASFPMFCIVLHITALGGGSHLDSFSRQGK